MTGPSVLHVAQPTTYGVAHYVAALAARQHERGWRVAVASPAGGSLEGALRNAGVTHVPWEAGRSPGPGTLAECRRLRRILQAEPPDVLHLHSSKAGLVGRLVARGNVPTIFQPHAWSFFAGPPPVRRAALAWERAATRWADRIVCGSEGELRSGREAGIDGPLRCIPNAIDADRFGLADDDARAAARARLGLRPGPLTVCLGRLSEQKGQDLLLDAWPAVRAAVPAAELVLVGDGPMREQLQRAAPPEVRFAGATDDVAPWLAAADVVVQPSRYETLSLSMLEAMASGRTVVATDVQGAREALLHGTSPAGAVVPLDDPAALAAAVAQRLGDPEVAAREGAAGRAAVERRYCLPVWFEEMAAVTLEVAGGSR